MAPKHDGAPMQDLLRRGPDELAEDAARVRAELQQARYSHAAGRLTKTHTLAQLRRRLARTLTACHLRAGAQVPTPVASP